MSHFKFFDAPTDEYKWKLAQIQAARGDQVLLEKAIKALPNHFDLLDGMHRYYFVTIISVNWFHLVL